MRFLMQVKSKPDFPSEILPAPDAAREEDLRRELGRKHAG